MIKKNQLGRTSKCLLEYKDSNAAWAKDIEDLYMDNTYSILNFSKLRYKNSVLRYSESFESCWFSVSPLLELIRREKGFPILKSANYIF